MQIFEKKDHYFLIFKKIKILLQPVLINNLLNNIHIMTKADIVSELVKSIGVDRATVQKVIEGFMESIKTSLKEGESVYLRGFGSYTAKKRATKTARNISKNETITIPEHWVPSFKPSKSFVKVVKENVKK